MATVLSNEELLIAFKPVQDVRLEELEAELATKDPSMHEKSLQVDDSDSFFGTDQPVKQLSVEPIDEEKIVMHRYTPKLRSQLKRA